MEPKLYHQLWIHREMLRDKVRCEAYRKAIFRLVKPGSVVLDVGTGTGIMAMYAAQAGARRVYAVERTSMADIAKEIIRRNGLSDAIRVVKGDINDVKLPEKVDVLISEWMGGFAVDENLADPICLARDRWLKPGGIMVPDTVTVWLAPVWDAKLQDALHLWESKSHGVDLGLIADYMTQEIFNARHDIVKKSLLAEPKLLWTFNTGTIKHAKTTAPFRSDFCVKASKKGMVNALAAWFHADFKCGVMLTNAPDAPGTHWGRTIMPMRIGQPVQSGTDIRIKFICTPVAPNLCDTEWKVKIGNGQWNGSSGRQGCTASLGFG